MNLSSRLIALIAALACLWNSASGFAQFKMDSKWVPENTNFLVLLNAERVFQSELAMKENWSAPGGGAFELGASIVPPGIGRVMFATQMDLHFMQPISSVGIFADDKNRIDITAAASAAESQIELIGDRPAVSAPCDQYLIQLDDHTIGMLAPASRQAAARWLRSAGETREAISPYLKEAMSFADANADIIVALDLQDAIGAAEALAHLKEGGQVAAADAGMLSQVIANIRGVTLGVTVRDRIQGSVRVDFVSGTPNIALMSKTVLLGALQSQGLMIPDLNQWQLSVETDRVVFHGPLTTTALRQINLAITNPIQAQFTSLCTAEGDESIAEPAPTAGGRTRQYLDALELYFQEIDTLIAGQNRNYVRPFARWFESYANKIDSLSAEYVDPELLEFAGRSSSGLRDMSRILTYAFLSVESRIAYERTYYGYRTSATAVREAIKAQEYGRAQVEALAILDQIRSEFGDMKRKLATKYGSGF